MRKIILALAATTAFIACDKKENESTLHITGKINGLKQGKLYIQHIADSNLVVLDSLIIKGNSNFESNINLSEPEMLYLTLDRGISKSMDNMLPFFAEPGTIKIETDLNEFYAKAKITGSKNNDLYNDYLKIKQRYADEQNKTMSLILLAKKTNSLQKLDSLNLRAEKLTTRNYLDAINFSVNNAKHEVAPYIALTEIYDANIKYLDTIQKSMSPEVAKSKYGKQLSTFISERKKLEQPQ